MITILVCGGREYDDRARVRRVLDKLLRDNGGKVRIIHGGCGDDADHPRGVFAGADGLGHAWAQLREVEVKAYAARWRALGKPAGPIRNAHMLAADRPQLVVAFPGGNGTTDMIAKARRAGVAVLVIEEPDVAAQATRAQEDRS